MTIIKNLRVITDHTRANTALIDEINFNAHQLWKIVDNELETFNEDSFTAFLPMEFDASNLQGFEATLNNNFLDSDRKDRKVVLHYYQIHKMPTVLVLDLRVSHPVLTPMGYERVIFKLFLPVMTSSAFIDLTHLLDEYQSVEVMEAITVVPICGQNLRIQYVPTGLQFFELSGCETTFFGSEINKFDDNYVGMSDKMDRITLDRKINELIANGSIKEASEYHEYMLGFLKGLKFVGNDDNALDNKI